MQNPLISIIIPTYNRAYIISETLDSIIAQTYAYWECIVVDDGSDDNTSEVMKAYCECDNRIQYHKRPENIIKGASSCRNYGIKRSEGEYIQFLDSDDVLNKVKLEEQINVITKADKFSIATCKWGRFSNVQNLFSNFKNEYISYKDFDNGSDLLKSFAINREFFPVSVYLISRVLLDKSGHWNEKLSNNDDGELFVRILLETNKIFFVKKSKFFYRQNNNEKLSHLDNNQKIESAIESWKLIEEHLLNKAKKFEELLYVKNAKMYIYNEIKSNHSGIIKAHKLFFKEEIKHYSFLNRLKRKLF